MASTDSPSTATTTEPTLPLPIFTLAHRYLLYDINTITYLRATHNIIGVLIGGLPQAPQQNVFQGIPLELLPEEARLLVEKNIAYIVDDTKAHRSNFLQAGLSAEEKRSYESSLRRQGLAAAKGFQKESEERKKAGLVRKMQATGGDWNDLPEEMLKPAAGASKGKRNTSRRRAEPTAAVPGSGRATPVPMTPAKELAEEESLFGGPPTSSAPPLSRRGSEHASSKLAPLSTTTTTDATGPELEPWASTPTTTHPAISVSGSTATEPLPLPPVPEASYPLYKHLHSEGYFLAPGLRFGCQYMAYPGDPLRFHSHFLCKGLGWDEEFDLLELVGGGRLGTGVKKGFLLGGQEEEKEKKSDKQGVRTFCVEWGGM